MFGTSGVRGTVGESFTADVALDVGRAVACGGAERVVVGRDVRVTGPLFVDAVAAGLRECGADVVHAGRVPTPTVARSVAWYGADAGVAVTASHNPPTDNGLKLWSRSGQAFTAAEYDAAADRVRERDFSLVGWADVGSERRVADAAERHVAALRSDVDRTLDLDVVVDVGTGTGQVTARALDEVGCRVRTLDGQPDGRFPGRPSEPTGETCAGLCSVVAATGADLGVAHDGDADRTMAVTEAGEFVRGDDLLAVFARDAAAEGDTVVAPVNASLAVDDALADVGASVVRTQVGDGYVAKRLLESGAVFGGEPSGAWLWADAVPCPDGPLAAVRLAALVDRAGPLSDLVASVPDYPLRRDSVEADDPDAVVAAVERRLADREGVSTLDGVRVGGDEGWFLVRASGTQPLVRVTAEARSDADADALFAEALDAVRATDR